MVNAVEEEMQRDAGTVVREVSNSVNIRKPKISVWFSLVDVEQAAM